MASVWSLHARMASMTLDMSVIAGKPGCLRQPVRELIAESGVRARTTGGTPDW